MWQNAAPRDTKQRTAYTIWVENEKRRQNTQKMTEADKSMHFRNGVMAAAADCFQVSGYACVGCRSLLEHAAPQILEQLMEEKEATEKEIAKGEKQKKKDNACKALVAAASGPSFDEEERSRRHAEWAARWQRITDESAKTAKPTKTAKRPIEGAEAPAQPGLSKRARLTADNLKRMELKLELAAVEQELLGR